MQKTLLVCSRSTRDFLPEFENVHVVTGAATRKTLDMMGTEPEVVAIGGGAVIDTAKIIGSGPITCYPTTAAGSSSTSHSVCWDGVKKLSVKRHVPSRVIVVPEYVENLPEEVREYTTYDVISHCLDSMWSKNKTKESEMYARIALSILQGDYSNAELVEAGNYGGMAIERCSTTILHAMSYPLTAFYKIPHGKALGFLLPRVCQYYDFDLGSLVDHKPVVLGDIDWDFICMESLKYDKIHNTIKPINFQTLKEIIKNV